MISLAIRHARLATMEGAQAAPGDGPLAVVEDGAVAVDGERIAFAGPDHELTEKIARGELQRDRAAVEIDAAGALVTPGFVDPHTHLLFAGDRSAEFAQRLSGATYSEIAQTGGGIISTVLSTRAASDDHLVEGARQRLARLTRGGVTTVEVKSGYGASIEQELRLLRLIRRAGQGAGCDVVPTLLGLHTVPPEMDRHAWVKVVATELTTEAAKEGLAHGCDAFCDKGAFTTDECRTALEAGVRAGLAAHLHADQLTNTAGAALAAVIGCSSADHLERTGAAGVEAMARSGTTAVLLPLAAWFLRDSKPAQAAPFLAAGVPVALGSNLNPGSQRMEGFSLLLAAGCLFSGLSPAQALWACTVGATRALHLDDRGRLAPGLRADLVMHATRDPAHLPYHAGVDHARLVLRRGQVILDLRTDPPLNCG
jgi:imidazolonepropionase